MKKLLLIAVLLLSCQGIFAQKTDLSKNEIKEYSDQIREMMRYIEETFTFIGNPEASSQEKDIVFKESYSKIFLNDQVQIEDDLDENRSTIINKNVQSYLKDIDFFFQDVEFTFNISEISPQINDEGDTYFRVTMQRTIAGHNIQGDTVNNTCKRYVEVNIDPSKKDFKVASMYTNKPNETEELRNWWNLMTSAWKAYFGKDQFVYDTLEMRNIILLFDDSFVVLDENLAESTVNADLTPIYAKLTEFTKLTDIDISGNQYIHTLDPLYQLAEIKNLNCSNTIIKDVSPIRNLNKLYSLDISNSSIENISDLRYTNDIKFFKADSLKLTSIEVLGYYHKLTTLSLAGSSVTDLNPLKNCESLTDLNLSSSKVSTLESVTLPQSLLHLNISDTEISDLSPLANLKNLKTLNIDYTDVTDLSPLASLKSLSELRCRNTNINNIMPLKDLPVLTRIYCDNTLVNSEKADAFKAENSKVMVIYETQELQAWWNSLQVFWKSTLAKQINCDINPSPEELHSIVSMKTLAMEPFFQDASPIERLTCLESLDMENTKVEDLTPLRTMHSLKYLNIKNTKVIDLTPIENLTSLVELNIEGTNITDLGPLFNMPYLVMVKAEDSKIKPEQVFDLKVTQPKVTVIYQTIALRKWWNTIDNNWREVFRSILEIDPRPTAEQLHAISYLEELTVDTKIVVTTLEPLTNVKFLRKLTIKDNHITDLTPLSSMKLLKELTIDGNPVEELDPLAEIHTLESLSIVNTPVNNIGALEMLENLRILDISNTGVKNLKALSKSTTLEEISIANTNIKSLDPIEDISTLKFIKAFNSKVKVKDIDELKAKRPEINILYH